MLSEHRCFEGIQGFYRHSSQAIGLPMRFSVYRPPQADQGPVPVLFYLAGLTCTEETFAIKAGAQRNAAELGLMLVTCDTSPRNTGIAGEADDWEFGAGAGFYVNATQEPWARHFRMYDYVLDELRGDGAEELSGAAESGRDLRPLDGRTWRAGAGLAQSPGLQLGIGICPDLLADPLCLGAEGAAALSGRGSRGLGRNTMPWSCSKPRGRQVYPEILVDQGLADKFLHQSQLLPELLESACAAAGQPLRLRRREGYDHGYYFISTFISDHLQFHAAALKAAP